VVAEFLFAAAVEAMANDPPAAMADDMLNNYEDVDDVPQGGANQALSRNRDEGEPAVDACPVIDAVDATDQTIHAAHDGTNDAGDIPA
jgi:hypothetical protein